MKLARFLFFTAIFLGWIKYSYSQEVDSVKHYYLKEVTVKGGIILEPKTVTEINFREIEKSDVSTVSELAKYIPSVKLQTNSRGESLFYLRGSGERQIALFFDGVPLNIPWDNRIDLSLIPTDAIGGLSVTRGIPSVTYGANTLAGVVNINSKEYSESDKNGKITFQLGENKFRKYSGFWLGGNNDFSFMVSASYKKTDGYNLPESYDNPTVNPSSLRLNSYSEHFNSFAKLKYNFSNTSNISASVSYIDSEKGVPPETDVASPRFWQYPLWNKLTLTLNGTHRLGADQSSILVYSFSGSRFKMQINQYTDMLYTDFDDIEKDNDLIMYGRINLTQLYDLNSLLKFTLSGYTATHKEKFLETNFEEEFTYSQNVFSAGAEYEYIQGNYAAILGASFDGSMTPQTGDKPAKDPTFDYSINSSLVYSLNDYLSAQFNFGRKTRFPTLREAFSGALGKFVINPDLKAEVAHTGELGLSYQYNGGKADLNLFLTYLKDGIIRSVVQAEDGSKKYQRINEDAIRTYGVELYTYYDVSKDLSININFTYLNSNAKNADGEYRDTLEYKPNFVAGFILDYSFMNGFNSVFEINYVGNEFGLQGGNEFFQPLPEYILANVRLSYEFALFGNVRFQAFMRVNNIFDKLYYTQWSLPEAGRQIWGGLIAEF
ncbi:TonB-dependent receptor plug domain-containing protein [Bacteroidota bacterium]